ncbi:MAG TPA: hypothetical protein VF600_01710 [Abditibacteriaceae bacterium]|jgi:hypothetical protein
MKTSLIAQDEAYERAVTSDADYNLLLGRLVKFRRQLTTWVLLAVLCAFYVMWRDFPYAEQNGEGLTNAMGLLMGIFFFAAIRFTVDTSIKLLKAIKAALIIDQQQHNTSTAV